MSHACVSNLMHCTFGTKDRYPFVDSELESRLWPYLGGIARENRIKALAIGGTADHVHALLSLPSMMSFAKAVQLIKGGSSKWVHDTFPNQRKFGLAGRLRRIQRECFAGAENNCIHQQPKRASSKKSFQ